MSELEWKDISLDFKLDDESGEFQAYFAAFQNIDLGHDILEKGAVANVTEFLKSAWIGVNHNVSRLPVAYPTAASQDNIGFLVAGRFHSTPAGQECRTVIKERRSAGLKVRGSIGYKVNDSAEEKINGQYIRRLKSIDVWECSFVNLAMNPRAELVSAKSLHDPTPKLIGVDDLMAKLQEFETKAGKVISKTNYNKLKDMHAKLGEAHATLGTFLDQHNPDAEPADDLEDGPLVGGGGRVVGKAALLNSLRLRSLRSRIKVASLHRE